MLKVTVFYDYNCPYCYLGTMSLNELLNEFEMDFQWKGFEIHPEFPLEGRKSRKSLRSLRVSSGVSEMALKEGVEIKLPGFAANSRLCLEASEFAKTKGLFKEFHLGAYEAYFRKALNIGDIDTIMDIGVRAGLDKSALRETLEKRVMYQRIEDNKEEAKKHNILGVPTYIFGTFPVHGYQPTETFRQIIQRAVERSQ